MKRASVELADILGWYKDDYLAAHHVSAQQRKVISSIATCRTASMGGHVNQCDHCGHKEISYNSCRNRHCPKCNQTKQLQWAEKLHNELMPIRYFHLVFTLPHELNKIVYYNQKICYDLLFACSYQSLKQAAMNPAYLGVETGSISVLHTWGQTLQYHPHVHMVVPGGGISADGIEWKHSHKKFFVPVKALMKMYRAKYLEGLIKSYKQGKLKIPEGMDFEKLTTSLWLKSWNVYSKRAFRGPKKVICYLGRYTHRVAITNSRILSVTNDRVKFRWKDYRDNFRWKEMELEAGDFITRFLLHVLPDGYYKIRYFGILASSNVRTKRAQCFTLLDIPEPCKEYMLWTDLWEKVKGINLLLCPVCKKGKMILAVQLLTSPSG